MEITGRHVLFGMIGAFSIIIGVNVYLAVSAVRTFPGLEVANSYVASQSFDADRAAQEALGWDVAAHVHEDTLRVSIRDTEGNPVEVESITGIFGRATEARDDQIPEFTFDGADYIASVNSEGGNWNFRMEAIAPDGTEFKQRLIVLVE